jgi:hypothetical protein
MVAQSAEQMSLGFLPQLPVVVQRHTGQISSDAGLLPIREFDQKWKLTQRMAACLDDLMPGRGHSLLSMLRQRIFGIIAGYEDCNDHDTLRDDPVFKLVAGDDAPGEQEALASQPTLSRFENQVTPGMLLKLVDFTINTGVERLRQHHGGQLPESLILDLDSTDDPTHGHQQLSLFHGYYGQYQFYPLIISEPTTKHVFVAWLRFGTAHASLGADDDLMRVVNALRAARPDIKIHVRGDAGYGLPLMYEICENNGLSYTLGFSSNARLKRMTESLMQRAIELFKATKNKARLFECFSYKCGSWSIARMVIAKAECHEGGTNLRFVLTNLPVNPSPQDWPDDPVARLVYDDYIQRGESEHRMDELKNGLCAGRLSCHRFMANFFRLLLHTAAFNLLNAIRDDPKLPQVLRAGQPCTWRMKVIKVAAEITITTRRVIVRLAAQWPWWKLYHAAATRSIEFNPRNCFSP